MADTKTISDPEKGSDNLENDEKTKKPKKEKPLVLKPIENKTLERAPSFVFAKSDKLSRLEKYDEIDKKIEENKPFEGTAEFHGPLLQRKYTDAPFTILFIICNGIFAFFAIYVWSCGVFSRLTNGMDFRAEICGIGKLANLTFQYYAHPVIDANVVFCVKKCPTGSGPPICLYDVDPTVATPFCYNEMQAKYSGKYCLPIEPVNRKTVLDDLDAFPNLTKRIIGDLALTLDIMGIGLLISVLCAWLSWILMKKQYCIKFNIWLCVLGTFLSIGFFAAFCYREYQRVIIRNCLFGIDNGTCGGGRAAMFWYACWVFCGISGLYLLIILKLCSRINLVAGLIKATAKCCVCLKQLNWIPWIQTALAGGVGAILISGITLAFSVGEVRVIPALGIDGGYVKKLFYEEFSRNFAGFAIFMFLWWFDVILLFGDMMISYSLCIWFFTKRKETVLLPVPRSLRDTVKYHIGTLFMLSFFKLVFWTPRVSFGVMKKILRKSKQHYSVVRFFQACCMCCIHSFEIFFRYISKHLIIQVCLWSDGYFVASKKAYFLLFRHKDLVKDLDFLQVFVLFQNKICCASIGAVFVYVICNYLPYFLMKNDLTQLETPIGPTIAIFYLGFFYASVFQGGYDIAMKTILQCYLMDDEMFVGDQSYTEEFVSEFMELYKKSLEERRLMGKYGFGLASTLGQRISPEDKFKIGDDNDIDENENMKKKGEGDNEDDESSEEEEEEEEQEEEEKTSNNNEANRPKSRELNAQKVEIRPNSRDTVTNSKKGGSTNAGGIIAKVDTDESREEDSKIEESSNESDGDEDDDDDESGSGSEGSGSSREAKTSNNNKDNNNNNKNKVQKNMPNRSGSDVSDNSLRMFNNSGKEWGKPNQKSEASMNQVKRDTQSLFNKSKINNSTMRLDFDDREDKLDYRL